MRAPLAVSLLLALVAAGCASAPSLSTSPLLVEPGADVGSPYLPSLVVRDDGSLDVHAVGVPGALVRIEDAFHVTNRGSAPLSIAFALREPAPVWGIGPMEAVLAPGDTLVGFLSLTLPEDGAAASQAGFDVVVQVHE